LFLETVPQRLEAKRRRDRDRDIEITRLQGDIDRRHDDIIRGLRRQQQRKQEEIARLERTYMRQLRASSVDSDDERSDHGSRQKRRREREREIEEDELDRLKELREEQQRKEAEERQAAELARAAEVKAEQSIAQPLEDQHNNHNYAAQQPQLTQLTQPPQYHQQQAPPTLLMSVDSAPMVSSPVREEVTPMPSPLPERSGQLYINDVSPSPSPSSVTTPYNSSQDNSDALRTPLGMSFAPAKKPRKTSSPERGGDVSEAAQIAARSNADNIPTNKDELFAVPVYWDVVDSVCPSNILTRVFFIFIHASFFFFFFFFFLFFFVRKVVY
jgi:flagellar biosynthesis GTPase FlhF